MHNRLFCLIAFVITTQLNVTPSWGGEISDQVLVQKFTLKGQTDFEDQEFQNSNEDQKKFESESETKAFNLSLYGTLIPVSLGVGLGAASFSANRSERGAAFLAVAGAGLVIGPSLGYFYAGKTGRGLATAGLRFLVGSGSLLLAYAMCPLESSGPFISSDCGAGEEAGMMVVIVGGGLVVFSAIYDIATVKKAVRKKNQEMGQKNWMITPKYFSESGAGGVEIKMKF